MFTASQFWSTAAAAAAATGPSSVNQSMQSFASVPKSSPSSLTMTGQSYASPNPYNMALLAQYNPWSHLASDPWSGAGSAGFAPAPAPPPTASCFSSPSLGLTTGETSRKRRTRTAFNQKQLQLLEGSFERSQYPDLMTRRHLSQMTELQEARIQVWFKNRRAKERKKRKAVLYSVSCNKFAAVAAAASVSLPPYGAMMNGGGGSSFCPHLGTRGTCDDSTASSD